jgi:hypothetical protein
MIETPVPVKTSPAMQRYLAAVRARREAQGAEAEALAELAADNQWDETLNYTLIEVNEIAGFRPTTIGSDDIVMDEDLPLEVAAANQISLSGARWLLRDVVNLRYRHPETWARTVAGDCEMWRARQIAVVVDDFGLTREEALAVDAIITPRLARYGWRRILHCVRAAVMVVAPDKARANAEYKREHSRYCEIRRSDVPGLTRVEAMIDDAEGYQFEATVQQIADRLKLDGDTDSASVLRSKAPGVMANPARAVELIGVTSHWGLAEPPQGHEETEQFREKARRVAPFFKPPAVRLYLHVDAADLGNPNAIGDAEGLGPVLLDQVKTLVGGADVKVTQTIHIGGGSAVDQYPVPDRIREEVVVRDRWEVAPYSTRRARPADLDHTRPWQFGRKKQTRASNLGPLTRPTHRAKTHAGWQLVQPKPGCFYWLTRRGQVFKVGPDGTEPVTTIEQLRLWALEEGYPDGLAA